MTSKDKILSYILDKNYEAILIDETYYIIPKEMALELGIMYNYILKILAKLSDQNIIMQSGFKGNAKKYVLNQKYNQTIFIDFFRHYKNV